MLGLQQNRMRFIVFLPKRVDHRAHCGSALSPWILRRMAPDAHGLLAETNHLVAGLKNLVVIVAARASWDPHLDEYFGMTALIEKLRIHNMTLPAYVPDPRDPRRTSAMISMAVVACGRGEIPF